MKLREGNTGRSTSIVASIRSGGHYRELKKDYHLFSRSSKTFHVKLKENGQEKLKVV